MTFFKKVGLPTCLSDIGVTLEQVALCAPAITKDEDLEHYPYVVTEDMILQATKKLL